MRLEQLLGDLAVGVDQADELADLAVNPADARLDRLAQDAHQLPQVARGEEGAADGDALDRLGSGGGLGGGGGMLGGGCLFSLAGLDCRASRAVECDSLIEVLVRGLLLLYKFIEGSRSLERIVEQRLVLFSSSFLLSSSIFFGFVLFYSIQGQG